MTTLLTYINVHGVLAKNTLLSTITTVRTLHLAKTVRCETNLRFTYSFEIRDYILNLVAENQCTVQKDGSKLFQK